MFLSILDVVAVFIWKIVTACFLSIKMLFQIVSLIPFNQINDDSVHKYTFL